MSAPKLTDEQLREWRDSCDNNAPEDAPGIDARGLRRLLDEHAAQGLALRNVKAMAKRMRKRGAQVTTEAEHLLRFCAEGGEPESITDILRAIAPDKEPPP